MLKTGYKEVLLCTEQGTLLAGMAALQERLEHYYELNAADEDV